MWLLQGTATINITDNLESIPQGATLVGSSMSQLIVTLVDGAILVGAILLLLYLILGGIQWITAGGDKSKVESAREKIIQSVIGFIVLVAVYTLFTFMLNVLDIDLGQGGGGGGSRATGGTTSCSTAADVGRTANDGGAGGYCSNEGAARVKCYGPGQGVSQFNYYHWEPCSCISGSELPQYTFSCN